MEITGTRVVQNLTGADNMKRVRPGDFVIHLRSFQGGIEHSDIAGKVSLAYTVLTPRPQVWRPYYRFLLKSERYVQALRVTVNQLRDGQSIRYQDFARIHLPLPPLAEQQAIADFLDRETAKIDTLIEKQNALIERLRERRTAVVEAAMNTDAPSASLGFLVRTLPGHAFPSDGFSSEEDDVPLLRGVNVKTHGISWDETVYWSASEIAPFRRYLLAKGDVVLGLDRPFVAGGTRVVRLQASDAPSLLLQRVVKLTPHGLDPDFLLFLLQSRAFREYAEPEFTGVSVPHLSDKQVRDFRVPIPPLDVQRSTAAKILRETEKIDTLIAKAERFVELARERRAALITAAVTGQIDVEGAA